MINFLLLLVASALSEDTYVFDKDEKVLYTFDMQGVKVDVLRRGSFLFRDKITRLLFELNHCLTSKTFDDN